MNWIDATETPPPRNHSMFIAWTPGSQRGSWDWCYRDSVTGEVMVRTSLGWEPLSNFGGVVSHWCDPKSYPPHTEGENG